MINQSINQSINQWEWVVTKKRESNLRYSAVFSSLSLSDLRFHPPYVLAWQGSGSPELAWQLSLPPQHAPSADCGTPAARSSCGWQTWRWCGTAAGGHGTWWLGPHSSWPADMATQTSSTYATCYLASCNHVHITFSVDIKMKLKYVLHLLKPF